MQRLSQLPRAPVLAVVLVFFVGPFGALAADGEAEAPRPAPIVVDRGTVAERQVVAVDRDLEVRGRALANVAAIRGTVSVSGEVVGDVVAVGGDVRLEPGARVGGDVLVLGGVVLDEGEASIGGRTVAYASASSSWLLLAEGPAIGLEPFSPVVVGAKLALLAAWIVVAIGLVATAAPAVRGTADGVGLEPLRNLGLGLVAVLAMILTLVFFTSFLNPLVGVPLLVVGAVVALALKLWGMVAVFCWLGGLVRRSRSGSASILLQHTIVGLLILGVLKLLPWLGIWVWTAATLVGIGATLSTKFGRNEAWLDAA